jgi:hypothetical protein
MMSPHHCVLRFIVRAVSSPLIHPPRWRRQQDIVGPDERGRLAIARTKWRVTVKTKWELTWYILVRNLSTGAIVMSGRHLSNFAPA